MRYMLPKKVALKTTIIKCFFQEKGNILPIIAVYRLFASRVIAAQKCP